MPEDFDPRQAALNHAGAVPSRDMSDFASAIACGLVYVGDQLAQANGYLSGIANLLETMDVDINNRLAEIAQAVSGS